MDMRQCVYLLRAGPYFKIGRSKDFRKRIRNLRTSFPFDIGLIHLIDCDYAEKAEKKLHGLFRDRAIKGEWFLLSKDDVDWICRQTDFFEGEFIDSDQEISLFLLGSDALYAGKSIRSNPFVKGTRAHKAFENGYIDCIFGDIWLGKSTLEDFVSKNGLSSIQYACHIRGVNFANP